MKCPKTHVGVVVCFLILAGMSQAMQSSRNAIHGFREELHGHHEPTGKLPSYQLVSSSEECSSIGAKRSIHQGQAIWSDEQIIVDIPLQESSSTQPEGDHRHHYHHNSNSKDPSNPHLSLSIPPESKPREIGNAEASTSTQIHRQMGRLNPKINQLRPLHRQLLTFTAVVILMYIMHSLIPYNKLYQTR